MEDEVSLDRLHTITNILGTVGPMMFGSFGVMALLGQVTSFMPYLPVFKNIAIAGLAMFIIGMLTIPIQFKLGYVDPSE